MKIVEPSFEIQEYFDTLPIAVRLEECGRVCYKSEDAIAEDSAIPFVTRIAANGRSSIFEMAVVSFSISCHPDHVLELLSCQPKFLVIDRVDNGMVVTGSIRAFRDLYINHFHNQLVNDLVCVLAAKEPYLFEDIFNRDKALEQDPQVSVKKLSLVDVDGLSENLRLRHRFISVRFIVSRAVSHELVRHRPCSFLQESQRFCRYSLDRFDNQVSFIKPIFFSEETREYILWKETMEVAEAHYLDLLETSTPQAARTVLPNSCKTEIIVYCNLLEWQHIFELRTSEAADPSMREVMIPLQVEMKKRFPVIST